jgi:ATP-dependent exoDNAse (exonuclease V) beta subunit
VQKLLAILRAFPRARDASFASLIERLEKMQEVGTPETEASVPDSAEDAIHLMTMHAAKGLEFPVVFLPSINRGLRFDTDPLLYSIEEGIGVSWLNAATGESFSDAAHRAIREKRKEQERNESDRLFYVAMTRAEEHLVLSAALKTTRSSKGKETARAEHWSKYVRDSLDLDFQQIDDRPIIEQREGWQFRLFRVTHDLTTVRPVLEHPQANSVAWVERAEPGDESDSETAVTSVALFAECPRRYYLSRYLGFAEVRRSGRDRARETAADDALVGEPDETDATELGSQVHAALAGSLPSDSVSGEALLLVENFRSSELGKQASAAEIAAREQHLTFAIGGHLLRGQIDLWFAQNGRSVLLDYKTDQVNPAQAGERLRTYGLQLQLYALALEQANGKCPDRAVAYFLRPNLALDVDLGAPALDQAREAVRRFFAAQSNIEFPLHVGEHCLRCPHYRGLCPAKLPPVATPEEEASAASTEAPASTPPEPPSQPRTKTLKQHPGPGQLSLPFQDERD